EKGVPFKTKTIKRCHVRESPRYDFARSKRTEAFGANRYGSAICPNVINEQNAQVSNSSAIRMGSAILTLQFGASSVMCVLARVADQNVPARRGQPLPEPR